MKHTMKTRASQGLPPLNKRRASYEEPETAAVKFVLAGIMIIAAFYVAALLSTP